MAELHLSVKRPLHAGHHLPDVPECQYPGHGHTFIVGVVSRATADSALGSRPSLYELGAELELVLAELQGKDLNRMMTGSTPTGPNIAHWVLERMIPSFPKITEVMVGTDDEDRYVVTRELR